jgi:hypothetical protein
MDFVEMSTKNISIILDKTMGHIVFILICFNHLQLSVWRLLWLRTCGQITCQAEHAFNAFRQLIPVQLPYELKRSDTDFTRNRKLPLSKLISLTLSLSIKDKNHGVDIYANEFLTAARRSLLWDDNLLTIHRSAVTKAREKVTWELFESLFHDAVDLAYTLYPDDAANKWHGMSVYAIDGSKYDLPATEALRSEFDPSSGLQNGKGHYPQCLVSTAYDVFRRLPVARTIVPVNGSERQEATTLHAHIPDNGVILYDRGYPSYQQLAQHARSYTGHFLFRCPAENTFPAVRRFINSKKQEDEIWITPSDKFLKRISVTEWCQHKAIKVRVVKLYSPDGTLSVLLTDLFGKNRYSAQEITNLYYRRWEIESFYRDEKITQEIEKFHSTSSNGIKQELFASVVMMVITRCLMVLSGQLFNLNASALPQFKNALALFSTDCSLLVANNPQRAYEVFKELLIRISKVKYYKPKKTRSPQPRLCKRPPNKWTFSRMTKLIGNA